MKTITVPQPVIDALLSELRTAGIVNNVDTDLVLLPFTRGNDAPTVDGYTGVLLKAQGEGMAE